MTNLWNWSSKSELKSQDWCVIKILAFSSNKVSKQKPRNRLDILPLRLDEEIRQDEQHSQQNVGKQLTQLSRSGEFSNPDQQDFDVEYVINDTEIGFDEIINEIDGIVSRVLVREYDKQDNEFSEYIGDEDIVLTDYLEWFFTPEEVFDTRSMDLFIDDQKAWEKVYWVAGYSSLEEDMQEFGPFDSFEGPPLRYAMVNVNKPEEDSLYDYSSIETSTYHPQVKLDRYTEDGSFPQQVLEQGPETI